MSTGLFRVSSALAGIAAVVMLVVSFTVNAGPPPGATDEQIVAFARQAASAVEWGAWLQAVGTILAIVFALAIVDLAGASDRLSGRLTLFGGGILTMVSLTETVFYLGALFPDPSTLALISPAFAHAVQHLYFIAAAPLVFLPLGVVVVESPVIPRVFGYLALLLGAAFVVAGVASLSSLIVPIGVTALAVVQTFWWLGAAIALIIRPSKSEVRTRLAGS